MWKMPRRDISHIPSTLAHLLPLERVQLDALSVINEQSGKNVQPTAEKL